MRPRTFAWLAFLLPLLTSCGTVQTPTSVPTPLFLTATLPPGPAPLPSQTSLPPTAIPTLPPIEGTTTTQINVRSEPSTGGPSLGLLEAFSKVQVTAKDAGGNWYQVLYPAGPEGKGWVRAQYVQVPDAALVPPLSGAPGAESGIPGTVTQLVNVRSGPGTSFDSLGTLNPQDSVALTGRNADGTWLQITFRSGPEGTGWIAAGFIQASGTEALPVIGGQGEGIGTGTPGATPLPPTPTVVAATEDGDSADHPAVDIAFSPSGSGGLQFSSEVSAPEGDHEDWVQFKPYTAAISVRLTCQGSGKAAAEVRAAGAPEPDLPALGCGEEALLSLVPGTTYLVHVQAGQAAGLQSTRFTLTLSTVK